MKHPTKTNEEEISENTGFIGEEEWRHSSVLVPLLQKDGKWYLLFQKRALHLTQQPGDVSFPGGRREPGETALQTALRETAEELCIPEKNIHVIGALRKWLTPMGRCISPYLGVLQDYRGTFSNEEVQYTFYVPLAWFLDAEPHCYHNRLVQQVDENFPFDRIKNGRGYRWERGEVPVYCYYWEQEMIWGLTARILQEALKEIKEKGREFLL